jgi:hypothetical protein
MGSAASTHVREWKIGGETSIVANISKGNGLSVSLGLALPLVNRLLLGPPRSPVGGRRKAGPAWGRPPRSPVQPLLPALFWLLPAEGMRMKSCLFFGQKFLTWTSPKDLLVVFLNSPC